MLANIQESATLQAESKIGEETAVSFSCNVTVENVSGSGNSVTIRIRNVDLYEANKTQVRNDQREFQNLVWETEDRLAAKQAEETSE
ncbi:hypothetical protein [Marinilactibacillus psychrotolerans]|uniref:Uncharacterized protein n=1 Tax=Marinilactibacillus psychrotolerans TaxID=191770 RepID=A0AAV3WQH2_9LACT|nr:hypothetical protein [Marinilactibacillus psychrotolerans]GEL67260.1 hypothetical protein MPS01_14150 [Marinilactibacillus psychrotolerans]GEQ36064.1 hypothetical protein M132T_15720 [Marinilactibacillus psychrotolerans]SDC62084.1 hypothetical protein SAMN04488013_10775 [Marinilactibacillus psychrotolerans]